MEKIKKIQLSPTRIVQDAITVWSEPGPEVDIVMDLKNLTFREGSIEEIYSFHVLDHFFPDEVTQALQSWKKCLEVGAKIFIIVDDFEYICRGYVGGDLSIDLINERYNHPTQFTNDNLIFFLKEAGFKEDLASKWFADIVADKFPRKHFELVIDTRKHE